MRFKENIMSIICQTQPDRPGLVSLISSFFSKEEINIIECEEHVENQQFLMRITIQEDEQMRKNKWQSQLKQHLKDHHISVTIKNHNEPTKLVLFCSKETHCLMDIISQIMTKECHASIECVISNHRSVEPICNQFGIRYDYVSEPSKEKQDSRIISILDTVDFDCIGLAKYMQILSVNFLNNINVPIINIHHSFLPAFIGQNPYRQAWERGVKLIGATAHYVIEALDEGQIITQDVVQVNHQYSINELKIKGRALEKKVFSDAIKKQSENKIAVVGNRTVVFH